MNSLELIDPSSEASVPAFVRHGSKAVKQAWAEGKAFESLLLEQLASSLFAVGGLGEEEAGAEGFGPGDGLLEGLGPSALAGPLLGSAPLGIARALAEQAGSAKSADGKENDGRP